MKPNRPPTPPPRVYKTQFKTHQDGYAIQQDMGLLTFVALGGGAVAGVVGAPFVLGAIGFTSAGIAAGSYAASMMSAAAVANGGGVAAGSLVAICQAAGAAGLSGTATAAVAGAGAATAAAVAEWLNI
ncbi:interferon alpha-inducible protein 27-like protein 2A isoform X2 [Perca fluviatilis]|uniref:interferon alpha-inducible protein 27-like protein 2A isoform X2 n=1 Tax=Perca fluviatilis TaxID=8168 RepID=UPI0019637C68|nr:interferon alpha-inducible protein 27-like protein 2A isoform X2 [Perca fluviatilis]